MDSLLGSGGRGGGGCVTEAELRSLVLGKLRLNGSLIWSYIPDSRREQGKKGRPDLLITGPYGCLHRELKGSETRITQAQLEWGRALQKAGENWDVWNPDDLASGRIDDELLAIS